MANSMSNEALSMETSADAYAGFWLRVGSAVIDAVMLLVPMSLLFFLLPKEVRETLAVDGSVSMTFHTTPVIEFAFGVICWLYKALLESSTIQATIGKRTLKLIVTDLKGERISFGTAAFRSWPAWLPWIAFFRYVQLIVFLLAFISCFVVGFTHKKQGLHDRMAKCFVVRSGA